MVARSGSANEITLAGRITSLDLSPGNHCMNIVTVIMGAMACGIWGIQVVIYFIAYELCFIVCHVIKILCSTPNFIHCIFYILKMSGFSSVNYINILTHR